MKTAQEIAEIAQQVKITNAEKEIARIRQALVQFKEDTARQYSILQKWISQRIEVEANLGKTCCVFWTDGDKVYEAAMRILLDELRDKGYVLKFYKGKMSEDALTKEEVEVSW